MGNPDHIQLGTFESRAGNASPLYRHGGQTSGSRKQKRQKARGGTATRYSLILVKIGICAGICAIFSLLKLMDIPAVSDGLSAIGAALNNANEENDLLGKLKFVELPGVLEVFAGEDSFSAPMEYSSAELDESATLLTLNGKGGCAVTTCGPGVVKATGEDSALGQYIIVRHESDIEIYYYGFEAVNVDEGQPLVKSDTLGTLGESGTLRVMLFKAGQPENPCKRLPVDLAKATRAN